MQPPPGRVRCVSVYRVQAAVTSPALIAIALALHVHRQNAARARLMMLAGQLLTIAVGRRPASSASCSMISVLLGIQFLVGGW